MIFLTELFAAFLSAMMVENLLFARAIDIPGLYEKRTPGQIFTIGAVLTVINCISSIRLPCKRDLPQSRCFCSVHDSELSAHQWHCLYPLLFCNAASDAGTLCLDSEVPSVLWCQLRHAGNPSDCGKDEQQLTFFFLLWLLPGCRRRIYLRDAGALVNPPKTCPHSYA